MSAAADLPPEIELDGIPADLDELNARAELRGSPLPVASRSRVCCRLPPSSGELA